MKPQLALPRCTRAARRPLLACLSVLAGLTGGMWDVSVPLAASAPPVAHGALARYPATGLGLRLRVGAGGSGARVGSGAPARARATARTRGQAHIRGQAHTRAQAHIAATKPAAKPAALHGDPARALLAYQAMQKYFYVQGSGLYKGTPYSFLWPFSQALAATVSLSNVPGEQSKLARELHARLYGLARYWGAPQEYEATWASYSPNGESPVSTSLRSYNGAVVPPLGAGGASYYDDNEWVGIELVRAYDLTHERSDLEQAEQIMSFVMAGWDAAPGLPCSGGVPFSNAEGNTDRNTVTDAPAAELGARLYKLTGDTQYLTFAETAYAWVRQCLLQPNGLYADHITRSGEIDPTEWSYNQGTMMGAGALLFQATGNGAYLYQARQTATAALPVFTLERMATESPFFASVYFRNLLYLDSITHDPPGAKAAQAYVDDAWENDRLSSGLFVSGSPATTELLGQAAIVQLYALLSSPPATYF
jgi:Glycosyl hydrolase family 76